MFIFEREGTTLRQCQSDPPLLFLYNKHLSGAEIIDHSEGWVAADNGRDEAGENNELFFFK